MNALFRSLGLSAAIGFMPFCVSAQRNVISARPGAVNYVEGAAFLNGTPLARKQDGKSFLQVNDVVATEIGKAEVLLTPGTFLRIGSNSSVRMVALSLTDIQVRVLRGEAMLEVDELTKDNQIRILPGARDGSALIRKPGLYRFTAVGPPSITVIKGKAEVFYAGRKVRLGKHHEVVLAEGIEKRKFDKNKKDDLYAWSNVRSEYESAASYQTAESAWQNRGLSAAFGGYGVPGWAWNPTFSSWAWLPGSDMAFFSPFGYGFFAPAVVAYAPIGYANTHGSRWVGPWRGGHRSWVPIAVNPAHPPATGAIPRSVAEQRAASATARRTAFASGFRTASGRYVPVGSSMSVGRSRAPRFRAPLGANPAWAGRSRRGNWNARRGARPGTWSRGSGRAGGAVHHSRAGFGASRMSGGMPHSAGCGMRSGPVRARAK